MILYPPDCKSLLHRLLDANPEHRIKMDEIMTHPWINEGHTLPFGPAPFPNTLTTKDINVDIVDHMVHVLKVIIGSVHTSSFGSVTIIILCGNNDRYNYYVINIGGANKWRAYRRSDVKQSHSCCLCVLPHECKTGKVYNTVNVLRSDLIKCNFVSQVSEEVSCPKDTHP